MDAVTTWSGSRADALRRALRMTNEAFAEHLGVAARTVAYWRGRADVVPRQRCRKSSMPPGAGTRAGPGTVLTDPGRGQRDYPGRCASSGA